MLNSMKLSDINFTKLLQMKACGWRERLAEGKKRASPRLLVLEDFEKFYWDRLQTCVVVQPG